MALLIQLPLELTVSEVMESLETLPACPACPQGAGLRHSSMAAPAPPAPHKEGCNDTHEQVLDFTGNTDHDINRRLANSR